MSTVCQHCHAPQAEDAAHCASCGRPMPEAFLFAPPVPLRPAQMPPEAAPVPFSVAPVPLPEPPGAMRRVFQRGLPALALLALAFLVAPFLRPVPRQLPAAARRTEMRTEASAAPSKTFINGPTSEEAALPAPLEPLHSAPAASPQTLIVPRQPGRYRIAGRLVTVQSASQPERAEQVVARPARRARRHSSSPPRSRQAERAPDVIPATPVVKVAASLETTAAPPVYHVVACRFPAPTMPPC